MTQLRRLSSSIVALAMLGLAATSVAHAGAALCSNATLKGGYSATITGTLAGAPFAELDLVLSTGNGTFAGTGTTSENGVISTSEFTATYTINSNCTGSATLSTGVTQNFNIKEDGSDVNFISTNSGATITGEAKRINGKN